MKKIIDWSLLLLAVTIIILGFRAYKLEVENKAWRAQAMEATKGFLEATDSPVPLPKTITVQDFEARTNDAVVVIKTLRAMSARTAAENDEYRAVTANLADGGATDPADKFDPRDARPDILWSLVEARCKMVKVGKK